MQQGILINALQAPPQTRLRVPLGIPSQESLKSLFFAVPASDSGEGWGEPTHGGNSERQGRVALCRIPTNFYIFRLHFKLTGCKLGNGAREGWELGRRVLFLLEGSLSGIHLFTCFEDEGAARCCWSCVFVISASLLQATAMSSRGGSDPYKEVISGGLRLKKGKTKFKRKVSIECRLFQNSPQVLECLVCHLDRICPGSCLWTWLGLDVAKPDLSATSLPSSSIEIVLRAIKICPQVPYSTV